MKNPIGWYVSAMKSWIRSHGRLLSRIAIVAVIAAIALPFVVLAFGLQYLSGAVPYPAVNPMHIAIIVSALLALVGLLAGLAVWTTHAPGADLGMAAVLVIGSVIIVIGLMLLTGYLMSSSHST